MPGCEGRRRLGFAVIAFFGAAHLLGLSVTRLGPVHQSKVESARENSLAFPTSNVLARERIDWFWPELNRSLSTMARLNITGEGEYAAAIVEMRSTALFELIVTHNMKLLGPQWSLYVFHGSENGAYVKRRLGQRMFGRGVNYVNIGVEQLDDASYNRLLKTDAFWRLFTHPRAPHSRPAKRVLIFQLDAFILRPGVYEFVNTDYVGAPWHLDNDIYSGINEEKVEIDRLEKSFRVGNGGLSLRNPAAMRRVIAAHQDGASWDAEQEDVFFVRHLAGLGFHVANLTLAAQFAVEVAVELEAYWVSGRGVDPWAVHQAWFYANFYHFHQETLNEMMRAALRYHHEPFGPCFRSQGNGGCANQRPARTFL